MKAINSIFGVLKIVVKYASIVMILVKTLQYAQEEILKEFPELNDKKDV